MKYQVSIDYHWQGEFSVEADTPEEAIEIVKDETFSDPWDDSSGNHTLHINEVYEWDEAAQERNRQEVKEFFERYDVSKVKEIESE